MTVDLPDILFPRDLQMTDVAIDRVLIVGSCGAFNLYKFLQALQPGVAFDFLGTNHVAALPPAPPHAVESYAFQFVQIALREVLTDLVVRFKDYVADPGRAEAVLEHARNLIGLRLASCLEYNRSHQLLTIVSNFPVPQRPACASLADTGTDRDLAALVQGLNRTLARCVAGHDNVFLMDWDGLTGAVGKPFVNDDLIDYYAHASIWDADSHRFFESQPPDRRPDPFPPIEAVYESRLPQLLECLWRQWIAIHRTVHQIDAVKLVVFDLDDTLWRGQIGEHYGDGDAWPSHHGWPSGLWEAVHHLRARGILVALASKNDPDLVRQRWDRALREGWLSLEDFAFTEIGWQPKAVTVARIVRAAGLTPRSVVFVDDNPVERESVRLALPGIRVLGENPLALRRILLWSSETQVARLSEEAVRREEMIRAQGEREEARATMSRQDFLDQLRCELRLSCLAPSDARRFQRCLELVNKTNQFNTTGRRWSAGELKRFLDEGGEIFAFEAQDRYTDYGLVGIVLLRGGDFEQVAMSCRVIGLDLEVAALTGVMGARSDRTETFTARIVPTEANAVCRDVYARCGFTGLAGADGRFSRSADALGAIPSHLSLTLQERETPLAA